jgi:small subunit ribosomal protein S3Ae
MLRWQNLIEVIVDAKTTDGYTLRVFAVLFTAKAKSGQVKKTAYAQSAQIRAIRKKITDIITNAVAKSDLKDFVAKSLCVYCSSLCD